MRQMMLGALFGSIVTVFGFVAWQGISRLQAQPLPYETRFVEELQGGPRVLGMVQGGRFTALYPEKRIGRELHFTTIAPMTAQRPETALLDLSAYAGRVIMVQGDEHGRWLYSAKVIDQASPITTVVLHELFAGPRVRQLGR